MLNRIFLKLCTTCLVILVSSMSLGQTPINITQTENESFAVRTKLAKTVFTGLAGAVLGLSTLSFYGKPEEHLSNIVSGFGIGLILGAAYVTFEMTSDLNSNNINSYSRNYKDVPELWKDQNLILTSNDFNIIRTPIWSIQF